MCILDYETLAALTYDAAERLGAANKEAEQAEPQIDHIRTHIRRTRALLEIIERRLDMPAGFEVGDRLQAMRDRPVMWAATREGFVLQLALLLEVGGLLPERARTILREAYSEGTQSWSTPLTNEWGAAVADKAVALLNRSPPRAAEEPKTPGEAGRSPQ